MSRLVQATRIGRTGTYWWSIALIVHLAVASATVHIAMSSAKWHICDLLRTLSESCVALLVDLTDLERIAHVEEYELVRPLHAEGVELF